MCMLSHVLLFATQWTYSSPGSSVHRILQARMLEWVAMPSIGGSFNPGIKPASLMSPALAGRFFTASTPGKPLTFYSLYPQERILKALKYMVSESLHIHLSWE